jgi:hypothetical protein
MKRKRGDLLTDVAEAVRLRVGVPCTASGEELARLPRSPRSDCRGNPGTIVGEATSGLTFPVNIFRIFFILRRRRAPREGR